MLIDNRYNQARVVSQVNGSVRGANPENAAATQRNIGRSTSMVTAEPDLARSSLHATLAASSLNRASMSSSDASSPSWADYASRENPLFQNLLNSPDVQRYIRHNADGSYSFDPDAVKGAISKPAITAKMLIDEQNHVANGADSAEAKSFTRSELQLFRDVTGWNLVQTSQGITVVDDSGNLPVPWESAKAAWNMFENAKGQKEWTNPGESLTLADLSATAERMATLAPDDTKIFDELIKMLNAREAKLEADAGRDQSERNKVDLSAEVQYTSPPGSG